MKNPINVVLACTLISISSFLLGAGCVAKNPELVKVDKESSAVVYRGKIYKLVEVPK